MEVVKKVISYTSTTGVADISACCWAPENESDIKAIFQISHGMAEHSKRYEDFAKHLCQKGFAVFINDHVGHGESVASDDDLGYFGERDGWMGFVNDAKLLTNRAREEYPYKPVILFGHSMGSFVARSYCEKFGADLAGAVFCGTSGANPAAGIGIQLASFIAKVKGSRYRSELINKIAFGSYNKKYSDVRTSFDWLTRDEKIVDAYIADKYCGFLFTAVGYRDMFTLLKSVSGKSWYENVPYTLPVLLVSGGMDPVGEYGKGVEQVYRDMKTTGHKDVTLKLYKDARHEILNELNRENVFEDISNWAEKKLELL